MNAEENRLLLERIDTHRRFILQAYLDNPHLLARAEPRIRWMLGVEVPFPSLAEDYAALSDSAPLKPV